MAGLLPSPRDLDEPHLTTGHPSLGVHNAVGDQQDPHHSGPRLSAKPVNLAESMHGSSDTPLYNHHGSARFRHMVSSPGTPSLPLMLAIGPQRISFTKGSRQLTHEHDIYPDTDISVVLHKSSWGFIRQRVNQADRVLDVGSGGGTFLWNIRRYTEAIGYGLELSASRARMTSRIAPDSRAVRGDASKAPFLPESFDLISCSQVIEHVHDREEFMSCLYALLKPGGLLLVSSVRRARYRLYYLRDESGRIILESSHVHEFDSLDEFNQLVVDGESQIVHTIEYQVRFSILDFILRRVHRFIRTSFTHKIAANGTILRVRKATKIPIPGYYYVETVVAKKGA